MDRAKTDEYEKISQTMGIYSDNVHCEDLMAGEVKRFSCFQVLEQPDEEILAWIVPPDNADGATGCDENVLSKGFYYNDLAERTKSLERDNAWYESIFNAIGDGVSVNDRGFHVLYQNNRHRDLLGTMLGRPCYRAFKGQETICDECPVQQVFQDGMSHRLERTVAIKEQIVHYEFTATPLRDNDGNIVAAIEMVRDITERKQAEERLLYMSSHDVLTGLYNRLYFEQELVRLERSRLFPLSLIMADVDDLKVVNDTLGHAAGDELLRQIAGLFRSSFRAEDIIARVGGDEFAVLLPETNQVAANEAIERIRQTLKKWGSLYGAPLNISLGLGIAESGEGVMAALAAADQSMYKDKVARTGRAPRQKTHYVD